MKTFQFKAPRFMMVLLAGVFLFAAVLSGCASADPKAAPESTVSAPAEPTATVTTAEQTVNETEQSVEQPAAEPEASASQGTPETPAVQNSDVKDSTASGTIESPVALGERFSWSGTYEYKENSYSAKYSVTVMGAAPITADEIANLGIQKPDEKEAIDYVMVDMLVEATDCTLISTEEASGTKYLSGWRPEISGSDTVDGLGVIGKMDYGFEGNLSDKIREATKSAKIAVGSSGSYTAQGKVILPVVRDKESLMTLRNDLGSDPAKIYFKLN